MNRVIASLAIIAISFSICFPSITLPQDDVWKRVDEGLFVAEFYSPKQPRTNDSKITIVKIDPTVYSFRLLTASEHGKGSMTPKKWCQEFNLVSAINAGMYQKDGMTSVGLMKNFNHINNPRVASTYKAVLAFNPVEPGLREIQIIDLTCQDFQKLRSRYQTLIQSIRMVSCRQENVWSQQDKAYGMAVFGMDKNGNVLFIFTESPYSGYHFINIILSLPISIDSAMYLEGGAEASLFFSANDLQFEKVGRYSLDSEKDVFTAARPVPNVIGVVKKY